VRLFGEEQPRIEGTMLGCEEERLIGEENGLKKGETLPRPRARVR
jgi:hypothetical protein